MEYHGQRVPLKRHDVRQAGENMVQKHPSTLTTRVAALETKMLHLQYRMKKIYDDQKALNEVVATSNREQTKKLLPAAFSVMDMLDSPSPARSML